MRVFSVAWFGQLFLLLMAIVTIGGSISNNARIVLLNKIQSCSLLGVCNSN